MVLSENADSDVFCVTKRLGAVAQLEERVVRNDEVGSSNLLGSTIPLLIFSASERNVLRKSVLGLIGLSFLISHFLPIQS